LLSEAYHPPPNELEVFMARNGLGHWVPGTSGNPGGRPKPPAGIRNRLAGLSPRAVERAAELLGSDGEREGFGEAQKNLDRHLGRPAIQADISLHRGVNDSHIAALLETARRRALEPILLEDVEVEISTATP